MSAINKKRKIVIEEETDIKKVKIEQITKEVDLEGKNELGKWNYKGFKLGNNFHGQGTFTQYYGDNLMFIYEGNWRDDLKSGYGILKSYNKNCKLYRKFTGIWCYDEEDYGELIEYDDKLNMTCKYTGKFSNKKKSGYGKLTVYNKNKKEYTYKGEWDNDYKHGKGIIEFINDKGTISYMYEGGWKLNNWDGYGHYTRFGDSDGYKFQEYIGMWKGNNRHGKGKNIQYNKYGTIDTVFEGEFKHNNRLESGKYVRYDRYGKVLNKHEGEWINGYCEITEYLQDRTILRTYKGQLKNGIKNGKGVLTKYNVFKKSLFNRLYNNFRNRTDYEDEFTIKVSEYDGSFLNNKFTGFGVLVEYGDKIKRIYEGMWLDNLQNGTGILSTYDISGKMLTIQEGKWEENKFVKY